MKSDLSKLEQVLRKNNAASFIDAVNGIRASKSDYLLLTLQAFYQEPELLYTALAYASARGVAVLLAPEDGSKTSAGDSTD